MNMTRVGKTKVNLSEWYLNFFQENLRLDNYVKKNMAKAIENTFKNIPPTIHLDKKNKMNLVVGLPFAKDPYDEIRYKINLLELLDDEIFWGVDDEEVDVKILELEKVLMKILTHIRSHGR
jgi:hypothetical protein